MPKAKATKTKKTKKTEPTHVSFLLDETGSMQTMKEEVISGFNKYINTLKKDGSDYLFSLVKFDSTKHEVVHDAVAISEVKELTAESFVPGASTPLFDSTAKLISQTSAAVKDAKNVLFVVFTDGQENSSREYNQEAVKKLIEESEKKGWTFSYLGVAKDAWSGADAFAGTSLHSNAMRSSGHKGLISNIDTLAAATTRYASRSTIGTEQSLYTAEEKDAVAKAND